MKKIYYLSVFAISALAVYAIRSYGYQKEVTGYINGTKAVIEAEEQLKKKEEENNDRLNK